MTIYLLHELTWLIIYMKLKPTACKTVCIDVLKLHNSSLNLKTCERVLQQKVCDHRYYSTQIYLNYPLFYYIFCSQLISIIQFELRYINERN